MLLNQFIIHFIINWYLFVTIKLMLQKLEDKILIFFISSSSKKKIERYILILSLLSFGIHLALIYLTRFNFIRISDSYGLLSNPISAIYTPFSFILI